MGHCVVQRTDGTRASLVAGPAIVEHSEDTRAHSCGRVSRMDRDRNPSGWEGSGLSRVYGARSGSLAGVADLSPEDCRRAVFIRGRRE